MVKPRIPVVSWAPFALAGVALTLAACGDLDPFGPCVSGASEACSCAGGRESVRVCRFDGLWSSCLCGPGEGGGVDPGAFPRDAGVSDAGAAVDAGAGADAGIVADGGGSFDAGVAVLDGGGSVDAGIRQDAGVADAGVADAGVRPDGGVDEYRAVAVIGGLDRLFITKTNRRDNRCTALLLVSPSMMVRFNVSTPAGWSLSSAFMTDRASDCDAPRTPAGRIASARDATGTVSFEPPASGATFPCTVDVTATLRFRPQPSWGPAVDDLRAQAIRVEGACP
jgi:hypothetical protein